MTKDRRVVASAAAGTVGAILFSALGWGVVTGFENTDGFNVGASDFRVAENSGLRD